ncbi:Uncharacterised protein [Mycobacterium tuberculosis]|nr:Uncharacterised protein [Mycobacterium tuberculosis]
MSVVSSQNEPAARGSIRLLSLPKAVSASIPTIRSCWRSSARIDPTHAATDVFPTPPLPSTATLWLPCRTVRIVASNWASWRCMPDRPRPTRPKVTSRTMRRQPRSPGRVRLRIGARAGSAQVLGGGTSGWRGQAGSGNGRSGAEGRRGGPGGVAAAACRPGGGAGQRSPDGGRGEYPRGVPGWCGRIRSRRNSSRSYISSSGDRRSIVAPVAG